MGGNGAFVKNFNGDWELKDKQFSTIQIFHGVKIVRKDGRKTGGIPQFSNTSKSYISMSMEGKLTQLRIYRDHLPVIDIDFSHSHHHQVGDLHVHDYDLTDPSCPKRNPKGRSLTSNELLEYGPIVQAIKEYNK